MQNLDDDCLRHIFLYLPPTDLLLMEKVSKHWSFVARNTWSSFKTLSIKNLRNTKCLNKIIKRADKYIKTLNLDECENAEKILRKISGRLPNLSRIKFNKDITITDGQLVKIFSNYRFMNIMINEDNIINVMRWGSKLQLHVPVARAALKALTLENQNLITEKDIFNLLMELERSERIFLRIYYCWLFFDNDLNIEYNSIIAMDGFPY